MDDEREAINRLGFAMKRDRGDFEGCVCGHEAQAHGDATPNPDGATVSDRLHAGRGPCSDCSCDRFNYEGRL